MKLTTRGKRVVGMITTAPVMTVLLVGLAAPAVAPSKAEAQMEMLAKYENEAVLPPKDLVGLLQAVGFKGQGLKYAWAVAMKESHGNALSYNGNLNTGDHSYGLFQINMLGSMGPARRAKLGLAYNAELLNPVKNAKAAYYMSGQGTNWSEWKGTQTRVVQYWLTKYPYKAHTQVKKAVAKAKAVVKPKHKPKH